MHILYIVQFHAKMLIFVECRNHVLLLFLASLYSLTWVLKVEALTRLHSDTQLTLTDIDWSWFRTGWWSSRSSTDTRESATSQTSSSSRVWTRETEQCWSRNILNMNLLVCWTALMEGRVWILLWTQVDDCLPGLCWKVSTTTQLMWWTSWPPAEDTDWRGSLSRELSPASTPRMTSESWFLNTYQLN